MGDKLLLEKKAVGINGEKIADAYVGNQKWNGWECPFFTKEEADKVAEHLKTNCDCIVEYDADKDEYKTRYKDDDVEDTEIWDATTVETVDGRKHVYCIGGWAWCWELIE